VVDLLAVNLYENIMQELATSTSAPAQMEIQERPRRHETMFDIRISSVFFMSVQQRAS
jgi:hypothetical protein